DATAGGWHRTGALGDARFYHTATLLQDGRVLVAGGVGACTDRTTCPPLASAEIFDPRSGTWRRTGSLNDARYQHTATLLQDGRVLVAGGGGTAGVLSSAELYDPGSGRWTRVGSLAGARRLHTATLLQDGRALV